jgi:hypothetical protein
MMIFMLGILGSKRELRRTSPAEKKRGFYLKMKIGGFDRSPGRRGPSGAEIDRI